MRSPRLTLRACTKTDGSVLESLYSDPEVARFIGGDRLDAEAARRQASTFASVWRDHSYGQSVLIDTESGGAVGRAGLHPWPAWGELELGWVLRRANQGRGLAREAAQVWLDWATTARPAPYLISVIHPDNSASIRLAERLGFTVERHDTTPWNDVLVYRLDLT